MTTDRVDKTEGAMLDADFAALRAQGDVLPSDALLDRIMMDADQVLAEAASVQNRSQARPGLGALLLDAIGGWPSLSGLAAATVAGLWIGVAPPAGLSDLSAGIWGTTIEVPLLESDLFAGLEG